jgi:hypothetical protein
MKPYGLKRLLLFKYPDLADCLEIGVRSQTMKMKSKTRRSARRYHKKRGRMESKSELSKIKLDKL